MFASPHLDRRIFTRSSVYDDQSTTLGADSYRMPDTDSEPLSVDHFRKTLEGYIGDRHPADLHAQRLVEKRSSFAALKNGLKFRQRPAEYRTMRCSLGHLELDRQSPDIVRATTEPCGAQRDAAGNIEYYLRNCRACGSTLCIESEVAEQIVD